MSTCSSIPLASFKTNHCNNFILKLNHDTKHNQLNYRSGIFYKKVALTVHLDFLVDPFPVFALRNLKHLVNLPYQGISVILCLLFCKYPKPDLHAENLVLDIGYCQQERNH